MFFSGFSPPRGGPALARPMGLGRGADLTLLIPKPEKPKSQNTPVNQRGRRRRGGKGGWAWGWRAREPHACGRMALAPGRNWDSPGSRRREINETG